MVVLETVAVAFSMFSRIPMPQISWDARNMRYALCAFPLIGGVIWGVTALWLYLCGLLALPELLRAVGATLIPVWITGGIHLDGYADTQDALSSFSSPEKRQEILKDPHLGAFAAIRLCCYFLLTAGLWGALSRPLWWMGLGFLLSRSLSGLAVAAFPLAKNTGLAHTFANAADRGRVRLLLGILSTLLVGLLCLWGWSGAAMAGAAILVFLYYYHMANRKFGGLSGDLAGWFLQTCELWMLLAAAVAQTLEVLL